MQQANWHFKMITMQELVCFNEPLTPPTNVPLYSSFKPMQLSFWIFLTNFDETLGKKLNRIENLGLRLIVLSVTAVYCVHGLMRVAMYIS